MSELRISITISRLRQRMLAVAQRYLGTGDDAEDAVQDSLLGLLQHEDELTDDLLAHAITTVRSRSIDNLRTRHTMLELDAERDGGLERSAEEEMIEWERRRRIEELIDSLPPTQQLVMKMHHYDGLPTREIARLTGMAIGTVRQNLSRGRIRLIEIYRTNIKNKE